MVNWPILFLGHFHSLAGPASDKIWSKTISSTSVRCGFELAMQHVHMNNSTIKLIIEASNHTSWVAQERLGNSDVPWTRTRFNLGVIAYFYRVVLEIDAPYYNSSIAIDNIRLADCFSEAPPYLNNNCTADMFCCNNGSFLNKTQVCDLTPNCAEGEDEIAECDKVPPTARCNFERGWCGWTNVPGRPLNWTLQQGETLSEVRFFYHQFGERKNSLGLYIVRVKPYQNQSIRLWWSYGNSGDIWYNQAIPFPDIRDRYFLQFEATKGYNSNDNMAIDDFSLSPECFGIGVPPAVVGDFDYYREL